MATSSRRRKDKVLVLLGKKIASLRKDMKISQEQFADDAGLHRTYQGMVERGERNLTIINLLRICTALGVRPGEVLDDLPEVLPKKKKP